MRPYPRTAGGTTRRPARNSSPPWSRRSGAETSSPSRAPSVAEWAASSRPFAPATGQLRKTGPMLTLLAEFSTHFSVLNVFRYITFRAIGATATALLFVFMFGPKIIDKLRLKQGKGQPIRDDGPQSHLLSKKGTPTMGGLMILSGLVVATLLWANLSNPFVWIVLAVTLGYAAIGFYDDFLKVTEQSHRGFSGRSRLAIEALIGLAASVAT